MYIINLIKALKNRLGANGESKSLSNRGERRLSSNFNSIPVSALALDSALELTQHWRSISRQSMLHSMIPIFSRRICILPILNPDDPIGASFAVTV